MQTYFIDGFRIAARSLTQAQMAAETLKRAGATPTPEELRAWFESQGFEFYSTEEVSV